MVWYHVASNSCSLLQIKSLCISRDVIEDLSLLHGSAVEILPHYVCSLMPIMPKIMPAYVIGESLLSKQ